MQCNNLSCISGYQQSNENNEIGFIAECLLQGPDQNAFSLDLAQTLGAALSAEENSKFAVLVLT